ncbi:MAG TPA: hypothetical protein VI094_17170 [Propionibacteriaceae bacterium]
MEGSGVRVTELLAALSFGADIDNPLAPMTYAISLLHCMTVSLAAGGAGLGTGWGEQVARRLLSEAGFGPVNVYDAPRDPSNAIFITHRPE